MKDEFPSKEPPCRLGPLASRGAFWAMDAVPGGLHGQGVEAEPRYGRVRPELLHTSVPETWKFLT